MANYKLVFFFLALVFGQAISDEYEDYFILGEPVVYEKTDAGEIRGLMGSHDNIPLKEHDVVLGFITMQPRALLLPHYKDSALVFYVKQGEATVGWIHGTKHVKKQLKYGDVYNIPAGAVVYVLNASEDDTLELVGILDTSVARHRGRVEPFFVAAGSDPKIALAGFTTDVLSAAFKVSEEEIKDLFSSQSGGSIIRTSVQMFDALMEESTSDHLESVVLLNKKHKKDKKDKKDKDKKKHKDDEDKKHKEDDEDKEKHKEDTFNLFEKRMFENEHGWIASTMGEDISALKTSRVGVSVVRLRAGSLLSPHWNPEGAEFSVVINGSGTLQIAYPNGTNAVDSKVHVGTIFHVPQFLPACHIASTDDSFEFVTFTVFSSSSHMATNEGLQFLAGKGSVLQKLDLGILALAFNLPDHLVTSFLGSQEEAIILPSATSSSNL